MMFDENKKNKRKCKNKIIFSTPVLVFTYYLVTFHTIFAYFYFALFQCFHYICLKYTPNLEITVWLWDLPALLMAIFLLYELCHFLTSDVDTL